MTQALSIESTVVAVKNQVSSKLGDETVILGLGNSVYYGLDGVGTRIWELIQAPVTVGAIRDAILQEYDVGAAEAERDLLLLLERLRAEGLVETQ